jgi:hypothetical protein
LLKFIARLFFVVSGLRQSDFSVNEDGHPQIINLFRAADERVAVGLVPDKRGHMAIPGAHIRGKKRKGTRKRKDLRAPRDFPEVITTS